LLTSSLTAVEQFNVLVKKVTTIITYALKWSRRALLPVAGEEHSRESWAWLRRSKKHDEVRNDPRAAQMLM